MLNMCDPPVHTRIRGLVSRGFTPKGLRPLQPFLAERAARDRRRHARGRRRLRLPRRRRRRAPAPDDRPDHGRAPGRPPPAVHLDLDDPRLPRPRSRRAVRRPRGRRDRDARLRRGARGREAGATRPTTCCRPWWRAGSPTRSSARSSACCSPPGARRPATRSRAGCSPSPSGRGSGSGCAPTARCCPTAVEEILRWTSATAYNRRTATRDVELGGVTIRAGEKTTHWYPAANRDETVFADPDRFDVGRDPNPHLAFGHGIHHCLGASLARLEIATMLDVLLDRCAGFELAARSSGAAATSTPASATSRFGSSADCSSART